MASTEQQNCDGQGADNGVHVLSQDGYAVDEHGIHHRVLNAVLETKPGKDCYGCIDVYGDRLDLVGVGELDSQNMPFADQQANNSSAREQSHVHERPEAEEAALQRQPQ